MGFLDTVTSPLQWALARGGTGYSAVDRPCCASVIIDGQQVRVPMAPPREPTGHEKTPPDGAGAPSATGE